MSLTRRRPALAACLAVLLAACAGPSPAPTTSPSVTVPSLTPVPNGDASAAPESQTDTDWGRIWDALPPSFPVYPGAVPTETGEHGPVSAEFAVPEAPDVVTSWFQAALEAAGYSTEAVSGPLEDGSRVIDSLGTDGCRTQTVIEPLSGTTHVAVRFGADCAFE